MMNIIFIQLKEFLFGKTLEKCILSIILIYLKNKHYIANKNVSHLNNDYKKVWDPITNRYFVGTIRRYETVN